MPKWRTLACIAFARFLTAQAYDLSDGLVTQVSARLAQGAQKSWELGTRAEAILELNASSYSVVSHNALPPPNIIPDSLTNALEPFFEIAKNTVAGRAASNNYTQGPQPLIQDGSAADPASIGFAVLLANWTGYDATSGNQTLDYAGAAKDQLDFLLEKIPRTSDGAISHRVSEVQLWSDFISMVPPFLAYYGVLTKNRTLLLEAHNQISLYRKYLRDDKAQGLWRHVLLGNDFSDEGHWATGNGWAAAGMLRVLATIQNSEFANTFKNEQGDLISWVHEIHTAMYAQLDRNVLLFTNYPDQPVTASGNFYDAASTALLASTVYRLSLLTSSPFITDTSISKPIHTHLPLAEKSRKALAAPAPNGTHQYFTSDGWLTPVVNPDSFTQKGSDSPEGQAFVVMMQASWNDWQADGSKGGNGALGMMDRSKFAGGWGVWIGVCVGVISSVGL
ncbi:hypothetical protein BDN72DRAFT_848456 [Pluteus cervinus]|uniref:Uncharacterized protein n=1 Tax=Pluteus cervinus TaxID=181527 RepID=A0ACD3AB26_9AGAR|nr:hypothetical protein BDN72DRAFT_848456 [Pluteus cervinus]